MEEESPVRRDLREAVERLLPAETSSPDETRALGGRLAGALRSGDIVALHGDLGAGKTHLAKGICSALGVNEDTVTSPTFTLVHEYAGRDFPIYHLDAYRAERLEEWYELGIDQYLFGDGLCLIEWPDRLRPLLPEHTLHLRLVHLEENRRRVELAQNGAPRRGEAETRGHGET